MIAQHPMHLHILGPALDVLKSYQGLEHLLPAFSNFQDCFGNIKENYNNKIPPLEVLHSNVDTSQHNFR